MKEYYSLDFDDLKADIKAHMKTLPVFADHNFEGSAASQLIDILAYVTQYPAFYLSQSLNEFFMHTVQINSNVLKLAHQLNYLPNRKSAPYLVVNFQTSVAPIIIPKFTKFTMGEVFLTNKEDILINDTAVHTISLYEGEPTEEIFPSDGNTSQVYELANRESIDNDEFYVYVDTPDGVGGWIYGIDPWINLMKESFDTFENAYYIRYFEKFSIAFDNGNLFNMPQADDQIRVIYLKTNGTTNNGLTGDIALFNPSSIVNSAHLTITTTDTTKNGTDEETISEIKNRAPLFYVTQNRAVTESDHNIIAKRYSKFNNFSDVLLWGGEKETIDGSGNFDENSNLKDVGHVYVTALKASTLDYLTQTEIDEYIEFLDKQKFVAIFMKYIHANRIAIQPTINIKFKSVLDIDTIDIQNQINTYLDTNEGFEKTFYKSDIIRFVDTIDVVEHNYISYTTLAIFKNENPKVIRVNQAIVPGSITSTIDGLPLTDVAGVLYHNGSSCGTVNYITGWVALTKTFTQSQIIMFFEYVDKEKISLERENYLYHYDVILNIL